MRKRIFGIIEVAEDGDIISKIYDVTMMTAIVVSIIPLMFKETSTLYSMIDRVTFFIFALDYIMRLVTADLKLNKGTLSFVRYPFTAMAIIDLLSILPSVIVINNGLKLLKIFRLMRTFRVFRVFKAFRYSKNITIIMNVFKKQKDSLAVVGVLAVGYVLVSALVIFNIEPDTFETFFDAIYWATVSLTTVGYGDIFCVSSAGKIITMVSAVFGIAIVALPAGIITAGYMEEIENSKKD